MEGREVVEIEYNPEIIDYENLLVAANEARCADHVFVGDNTQSQEASKAIGENRVSETGKFRLDSEPKYYLSKTHYQYVPMTKMQQTKANVLVAQRKSPKAILSPRQIELANYFSSNTNLKLSSAIDKDLAVAWEKLEKDLKNTFFNETFDRKK